MPRLKSFLKLLLALLFVLSGFNHFFSAQFYLHIMPSYLPWHLLLVYLSGVCEIVLGVLLLMPKLTRLAAWGLIALLLAVFPANIHMVMNHALYPEYSLLALWARLPLQFVLIAWAYWYAAPAGHGKTRGEAAAS